MENLDDVDGMTPTVKDIVINHYPEHDKLRAMKPEIDAIADFLERLECGDIKYYGEHIHLSFYPLIDDDGTRSNNLCSCPVSIEYLLQAWSGIDQNKLETEKRQILDNQRRHNAQ